MHRITLFSIVVGVLLVPAFASATGPCPAGAESVLVSMNGGLYLTADGRVFQETNTIAGLQSTAGSCTDENGWTSEWPADTRLV